MVVLFIEGGRGGCTVITGGTCSNKLSTSVREIPLSVCHTFSYLHVLHDGCAANNMQAADQTTIKERKKKIKCAQVAQGTQLLTVFVVEQVRVLKDVLRRCM